MVLILHEAPLALADLPIGDLPVGDRSGADPTVASPPASQPAGAQPTGAGPGRWPRLWSERELLLERQHQILHDLISARILQVNAGSAAPASALEAADQRLLRQLRLHLRLEERWLGSCGCLCPGHRAIHQLVARDTQAGLRQAGSDHQQQLIWLRGLQAWLLEHTGGPDAHAYALARSISSSQP